MPVVVRAIIQHVGQICSAGSRLLFQQEIYDSFVGQVGKACKQLRAGTAPRAEVKKKSEGMSVFIRELPRSF